MVGQDGRTTGASTPAVASVAALLAVVLLAAVGVAAFRSGTASADTVLARGADAVLQLPDGTRRPAVEGETVPPGSTVLAGRTGARLDTRDREVHLGGDTAVQVVDGVRQRLQSGFVLVDAADAPGLEVTTASAVVDAPDGALVRVDGGPLVRVGVLRGDGDPALVRPAGRRTTTEVPVYFSVQVPAGGLPGRVAPFALTPGDAYEAALARDLVTADTDLTALGRRLDGLGSAGPVVLTALRRDVPADDTLAAGAPGSEGALGYLLASAAPDAAPLPDRYARVRGLRADGGSWGVVAAIVSAPVDRVGAALSALLGGSPVLAGAETGVDVGDVLGLPPGAPSPQPPAPGGGPAPGPGPQQPGPSSPPPAPQPSPTPVLPPLPPAGPLEPVVDVVEDVVDDVLDLVLPPSPAPSSPAPSSPAPPLVDLDLPPLLG